MPLALVDSELVAERRRQSLPEEMNKPVICVFDPVAVHSATFDRTLGELRDKVDIFWQAEFSRTCIEMGGIGEKIYPILIAVKKPILLVSELEIIPNESEYGVEMLGNIRHTVELKDVSLIVISSPRCILKVFDGARDELGKLNVNQFFTWGELEKSQRGRNRLFDFVSQVLGL